MTPEHAQQETAPSWLVALAVVAVLGMGLVLEVIESNNKKEMK